MKIDPDSSSYEPLDKATWGFTTFSEKINGRAAMIGFIILFILELITKQRLLDILRIK
jgi:hypothetical protein